MVISGTHLSPDTTATLPFINMAVFSNKKFRSSAEANTIAARYRSLLTKHPFALFGLPFIATMVAGSFFLTPATAIRYVRRVSKEEELGIGKAGRKVDMKEEYYVSPGSGTIRKCAN
jgi:cytochrome c oxidase assembly protein subunit 16